MMEWIISSCVIMLIIITMRGILQGKISPKLQYALWAVVLIRLLVPINFFESDFSIMNVMSQDATSQIQTQMETPVFRPVTQPFLSDIQVQQQNIPTVIPNQDQKPDAAPVVSPNQSVGERVQNEKPASTPGKENTTTLSLSWKQVLIGVWILGAGVTAMVFLWANLRLDKRLKQNRRRTRITQILPSYVTDQVATPCLFGLKRPAIYLTEETNDEEILFHVLAHELTHYKHKDHIWSALRCVCLCLHWYNPLVWVCAMLSKKDAELACDESTIRSLGEEERISYGKTLIRMTCAKREPRDLLLAATTMSLGKRTLKDRIRMIAKNPKTAAVTMVAVILILSVTVGCTFSGTTPNIIDNIDVATENTEAVTENMEVTTVEYFQSNDPALVDSFTVYTEDGHSVLTEEFSITKSNGDICNFFYLTGMDPSGNVIWTHKSQPDYQYKGPTFWGLFNDVYCYEAGSGVGLDVKSGEILWISNQFGGPYDLCVLDPNSNLCMYGEISPYMAVVDPEGSVLDFFEVPIWDYGCKKEVELVGNQLICSRLDCEGAVVESVEIAVDWLSNKGIPSYLYPFNGEEIKAYTDGENVNYFQDLLNAQPEETFHNALVEEVVFSNSRSRGEYYYVYYRDNFGTINCIEAAQYDDGVELNRSAPVFVDENREPYYSYTSPGGYTIHVCVICDFNGREGENCVLTCFDPNGRLIWTYFSEIRSVFGTDSIGVDGYHFINDDVFCLTFKTDALPISVATGTEIWNHDYLRNECCDPDGNLWKIVGNDVYIYEPINKTLITIMEDRVSEGSSIWYSYDSGSMVVDSPYGNIPVDEIYE